MNSARAKDEIDADLARLQDRRQTDDIARMHADVEHELAMRDKLLRMTAIAAAAVSAATQSAARIDTGVTVVAKPGAASAAAAQLSRQFAAVHADCEGLKTKRAAGDTARLAQLKASEAKYLALRAEADAADAAEADSRPRMPYGRATHR